MKDDILYLIIPAYNEEMNIEDVVNDWYPIVEKHHGDGNSRLVIIDDGSKDDTYNNLLKLSENLPLLQPITKENQGHGATILYGYQYAIDHDADFIFQTDSDGQTLSSEFEPFFEERDKYDMQLGHRNSREDGLSRVFVTKVLKFTLKLCFGVSILDANVPFRLIKTSTLKKFFHLIPPNFNLSNVILSVIFFKKGCTTRFIPITFRPRQGGVNSINLKSITKIGKQAIVDFKKINNSLK